MSIPFRLAILASIATSCAAPAGSRPWPVIPGLPIAEEEHAPEHAEGHGAGAQAVNFFLGGSSDIGDADGLTVGVDYEYRLSRLWGIGGFAEGVGGLNRSFSVGAQAYWHGAGNLILVAGPGLERRHDEWEPIARVGGFYEFPLEDGWILSPGIFYDFTPNEDLLIYGINLGYAF